MEREVRFIPLDGIELRKDEKGEVRGIKGSAAVFNQSTIIGGRFEERIAEGAFDDVLLDDVRGLFNHDPNYVLGRNGKTMTLRADEQGLHYDIPDLPASRADVLEAIKRGDVTGNSFSFAIGKDEDEQWEDRSKDGKLPLRTIKRFSRLFDVGPVTFPAYEETKVSARSLEKAEAMGAPAPCPACAEKDEAIAERDARIAQIIELRDKERAALK